MLSVCLCILFPTVGPNTTMMPYDATLLPVSKSFILQVAVANLHDKMGLTPPTRDPLKSKDDAMNSKRTQPIAGKDYWPELVRFQKMIISSPSPTTLFQHALPDPLLIMTFLRIRSNSAHPHTARHLPTPHPTRMQGNVFIHSFMRGTVSIMCGQRILA